MIYLLAAVVFYTVVKYSVRVWTQLRYEKSTEVDRLLGLDAVDVADRIRDDVETLKEEMKNKADIPGFRVPAKDTIDITNSYAPAQVKDAAAGLNSCTPTQAKED